MKWLTDSNGNKCSVEYFGSEEAAQKALDSLKSCRDCVNCSGCSRCSLCSLCSDEKNVAPGKKLKPIAIPKIANIHAKVYAAATRKPDALGMSTWHTCGTTHCRGGWIVTLAGAKGKALEAFFNTELAAMLIYKESGYEINPCRFYDNNEDALADMKRLAEQ